MVCATKNLKSQIIANVAESEELIMVPLRLMDN
jgi:hypothetical protein